MSGATRVRVVVLKNKLGRAGQQAELALTFNGTVRGGCHVIGCLLLPKNVAPARLRPVLADFSPAVEMAGAVVSRPGPVGRRPPVRSARSVAAGGQPALVRGARPGLGPGQISGPTGRRQPGAGTGVNDRPGCEAGAFCVLCPSTGCRWMTNWPASVPPGGAAYPGAVGRFGRPGRWLQQLARGQDDRPVQAQSIPCLKAQQSFDPP